MYRLNNEMLDPLIDPYYHRKDIFPLCGVSRYSGYRYREGKITPPIEFLIALKKLLKLDCCVEKMVVKIDG